MNKLPVFALSRAGAVTFWFAWHILAVVALIILPGRIPTSDPGADSRLISIALVTTYVATVILLTISTRGGHPIGFSRLISTSSLTFGSFFLFLLLGKLEYSRAVLLGSLLIAAGFLGLVVLLGKPLQKPALAAVALLLVAVSVMGADPGTPTAPTVENRLIRTSLYRLVARYYRDIALSTSTGGAIANFGDRYLAATGDGELHLIAWDRQSKNLDHTKLALRVPMNKDQFKVDAAREKAESGVFRTADILVQDLNESFRLFASYHYWHPDRQCFTLRVSEIGGANSEIASKTSDQWQTVYESEPCLPFKDRNDRFAGFNSGGRLALLDNNRMLLTLGDHMFDGVESERSLPQDPAASYGKTILIELDSHKNTVYTVGHRNPQGLTVDAKGNIWSTEHGPQGGDELNHIVQNRNYGWPLVTYGRSYGRLTWPLNAHQGRHDGFQAPAHAWVPSVGISNLVAIAGGMFDHWKDDLLIGALGDESLYRARIDGDRVLLTERIEIRERVRDLAQGADGTLVLWTEDTVIAPTKTALVVIEPVADGNKDAMTGLSRVEQGELIFDRCSGCHRVEDGLSHGIGPDLKGLFSRPAATARGYKYTEAFGRIGGEWTSEKLDAFLTDPESVTPGTSMQFDGMSDPAERATLIEYLQSSN